MSSPFVDSENDFQLGVDLINREDPGLIVRLPKPLISNEAIPPSQVSALHEDTKEYRPELYSKILKEYNKTSNDFRNLPLQKSPYSLFESKDDIEKRVDIANIAKYANNPALQKSLKKSGIYLMAKDDLSTLDKIGDFFNSIVKDTKTGWALGNLQIKMNQITYDVSRSNVDDTVYNQKLNSLKDELATIKSKGRFEILTNKERIDLNLKAYLKEQEIARLNAGLVFSQMTPEQQKEYSLLLKEQEALDISDSLIEMTSSVVAGSVDVLGKSVSSAIQGAAVAGSAGALTGNPVFAGTVAVAGALVSGISTAWNESAKQLAASSYSAMRERGVSQDTARLSSALIGGIGGSLEVGSMGVFSGVATKPAMKLLQNQVVKKISQKAAADIATDSTTAYTLKTFAKDYGVVVGSETLTEFLQERIAIAGEELAASNDNIEMMVDTEEGRAEISERISSSIWDSLKVMSILGVGAAAPGAAYNYQLARKSKAEAALLNDLVKNVQESKLQQRSPEAMGELVNNYTQMRAGNLDDPLDINSDQKVSLSNSNSLSTVYIDSQELSTMLRQGKLTDEERKALAPFNEQIKTALQLGADVKIPMDEFIERIADSTLAARITKISKYDPMSMTEKQIAAIEKEKASVKLAIERTSENFQKADIRKAEIASKRAKVDAFRADLNFVKETYASKLEEIGFNKIQSKTYTNFLASAIESFSQRSGMLPSQFIEQFPLDIKKSESDIEAYGFYDPKTTTIYLNNFLNKKHNPTTFIHESSHFFLDVMSKLSETGETTVKENFNNLLKSFGVTNDQWKSFTVEERAKYEEGFARNFEIYIHTGKAPSHALRTVFNILKDWFVRFYRSIREELNLVHNKEFGEDLPLLTDELRAVFDRILATDDALQEQMDINNIKMMFDEKPEDVSDADFAQIQSTYSNLKETALAGLEVDALKSMRWISNAQSEYLKKYQKENDAIKQKIYKEVGEEIDQMPVFQVRSYLAVKDYSKAPEQFHDILNASNNKLSIDWLKQHLSEIDYKKIPKNFKGVDGLNPDFLADVYGYDSGLEMIRDLNTTPSKKDMAEMMVQDKLMETEGFKSISEIRENINEQLYNDALSKFVAAELKAMSKGTQSSRLLNAAAASLSQEKILGTRIKDLNPKEFMAASVRQSKISMDLWKKKDRSGSIDAKYKQLVNVEMAKRAFEFQKRLNSSLSLFKRFFKQPSQYKGQDFDFIVLGRAILSLYGQGTQKQNEFTQAALDKLKLYDEEKYNSIKSIVEAATIRSETVTDYRDLTVSEFHELDSAMRSIWNEATDLMKVKRGNEKVEIDDIVNNQLIPQIKEMTDKPDLRGVENTLQGIDKLKGMFTDYITGFTKAESWAHFMDHKNPDKPLYFNFIEPIHTAANLYRKESSQLIEKVFNLLVEHQKAGLLPEGKLHAPRINFTFGGSKDGPMKREGLGQFILGSGQGKLELLGALLHRGNRSNYSKLLAGGRGENSPWGIVEKNENGELIIVDDSNFHNQIEDFIKQGVLKKEDFDLLQKIGDLIGTLTPEIQKAYKEMNGHYFDEIESTPFVYSVGAYKGWYAPIFYDLSLQTDIKIKADLEAANNSVANFLPGVPKGFTKNRVPYVGSVDLDILKLGVHIDRMTRYAYLEPKIKEVRKILSNKELTKVLNTYNRDIKSKLLMPYLTTAANQMTYTPTNQLLDSLRVFTRNAGVNIMFGNVWNAALQSTGGVVAIGEFYNVARKEGIPYSVASAHMRSAFRDRFNNSEKVVNFIYENSNFMKMRIDSDVYDIQTQAKDIQLGKGNISQLRQWFNKHGYFLQKLVQAPLDQVVWLATFNYYNGRYSFDQSVALADSMVKRTQGGTNPEDLSQYQITNSFFQSMMQFMGYFNTIANLFIPAVRSILKDKSMTLTGKSAWLVFLYGMMLGIPNLVAQLLGAARRGEELEDEEGDGYLDDATWAFMQNQISSALPMFGSLGTVGVLGLNLADKEVYNDRMTFGPAIEGATKGVKSIFNIGKDVIEDEETRYNDIRQLGTLTSIITGIPTARLIDPISYIYGVEVGQIRPESELSKLRGGITGTPAEQEKDK